MELKPGYKQTEVGPIPDDWEVKSLGHIAFITAGGTPSRSTPRYWDGHIPWITTSQIKSNTITDAEEFISEEGLRHSAAKLFPSGTLLMALYGQGKTRGKVGILGVDAATNQACAAIALYHGASREYVFHFLASQYQTIRNISNTGNQENLSGQLVRSILVLLPSEAEQLAITAALGDVDALLGAIEKLIAKKRDLKQAAMQQLLTGQQRLPGFHEEWEQTNLGDMSVKIGSGITPTGGASVYKSYGHPFLRSQNVGWGSLLMDEVAFIDDHTHESFSATEIEVGDVFLNITGASIGRSAVADARVRGGNVNQHVCIIRPKTGEVDAYFLNHFLLSIEGQRQVDSFQAGGNRQGLNFGQICSFRLALPPLSEQSAIAAVLSDMDAEIAALEARLAKTRALKQGMMQELLTGRIRLPVPDAEKDGQVP